MKIHSSSKCALVLLIQSFAAAAFAAGDDSSRLEEIVVTSEFRDISVLDTGNSVSVFDQAQIAEREARHLEQLLNLAPNVNFSAGASRGRYIQIRGVGERSQFIEPLNPSVGVLIDGIDFTGIGLAASTLDVRQVEILRGPQGTLYGANALAGLINLVSNQPSSEFAGSLNASASEYDGRTLGGVISGPVSDALGYRLAIQRQTGDGYIENDYLGRDDTANIDELIVKGSARWRVNDNLDVGFNGLYSDADNGYDGFSLDNTRHTLSDRPGFDRQESGAGAVTFNWRGAAGFELAGVISHADSNLDYGFDEDWAFVGVCENTACDEDLFGFSWEYSSTDHYFRSNRNTAIDLRLLSPQREGAAFDWVVGVYYRDQTENLKRDYTFNPDIFRSEFDTENTAVYGQLDIPFGERVNLVAGVRFERREADYLDSNGVAFDPDEDLVGGKLALEYRPVASTLLYALISRGYKAGGVNSNSFLPLSARDFDTEFMWNYEAGVKGSWRDDRLQARVALFYQDREEVQIKQSLVQPIAGNSCPCSFTDYFDNAAAGNSYGLELEANWQALDNVRLFASVGLMESEFEDFISFTHAEADPANGIGVDLDGREPAHAPSYQYDVGTDIRLADNLYLRLDVEGKDEFYFSNRHEEKSDKFELFNARLAYRAANWEVSVWGRNLTDRDTEVRGFGSFGNDPRKFYATEPYYQYGEPRVLGVSATYEF